MSFQFRIFQFRLRDFGSSCPMNRKKSFYAKNSHSFISDFPTTELDFAQFHPSILLLPFVVLRIIFERFKKISGSDIWLKSQFWSENWTNMRRRKWAGRFLCGWILLFDISLFRIFRTYEIQNRVKKRTMLKRWATLRVFVFFLTFSSTGTFFYRGDFFSVEFFTWSHVLFFVSVFGLKYSPGFSFHSSFYLSLILAKFFFLVCDDLLDDRFPPFFFLFFYFAIFVLRGQKIIASETDDPINFFKMF